MDFTSSSSSSSDDSDYYLKDLKYRKERTFQERVSPDYYTEDEFKRRFRFSKKNFQYLVSLVQHDLEYVDNRGFPLTAAQQVMVALRYYACGSLQIVTGDLMGISQKAACVNIHNVSKAFARLAPQFVKMPSTDNEISTSIQKFYSVAKIPKCIGCVDGCHIPIRSPGCENAELFGNRKGFFSINVQAVCDADCKIIDIVARWHGSAHDQTMFNFSHVKYRFEQKEFGDALLIGDGGYTCKDYLITPFRFPQTNHQHKFNKALCSTRVHIERCLGMWKRRFPVLTIASQIEIQNLLTVIISTSVLHNIAVEVQDEDNFEEYDQNQPIRTVFSNPFESDSITNVRDAISNTFV